MPFGKISSLSSGRSGRNCSSIKNRGAVSLNFALPRISAQYEVPSYFGPNRFLAYVGSFPYYEKRLSNKYIAQFI